MNVWCEGSEQFWKMVSKESPINLKAADQTKPVIPNNHTFSEPKAPPPPRPSTNNLLLQV